MQSSQPRERMMSKNTSHVSEPQIAEFKLIWKDEHLKTICAMANSEVLTEEFDKPHQSKPFNPAMASVFYKCGFIENWGRGTTGIIDECVEYGLPKPTFEYEWTAVVTTFYKADQKSAKNEGLNSLYALIKIQPNNRSTFLQISSMLLQKT